MIPLDPLSIGIGLAVWLAFKKQDDTQFGMMTPEREEVYRNALEYLQDPDRLKQLANDFQKYGLKVQATMLRKRAAWRSRSPELRAAHDTIFQRALSSTNIQAILNTAKAFEDMTATVKAGQLREHVKKLVEAARTVEVKVVEKDANGTSKVVEVVPKDIPRNTEKVEEAK